MWLPLAALALLAREPPVVPLPEWAPGPKGDLAFETSELVKAVAFRHPERIAAEAAPSGALSHVNIAWEQSGSGPWYIEEQRYGFDAVAAGLATGRQDLVDRGRRIFDWGFRQERPDGAFDCPDRFHSASFFIEAVAHAALLLEASGLRAANHAWVEAVKPKLDLAARWMVDPANEPKGRARDRSYAHRYYLDAAALGEAGRLTGDASLVARSWDYVREGLGRQALDGANPEKGGTDTSYHAVGLRFAVAYYDLVADDAQRQALAPMIERGLAWLEGRLRPDGTVDQTGNTRTGFGQEVGRNGAPKTMNYGSAFRAAYAWAMITRSRRWEELARALAGGGEVEKRRRAKR